MQSIIINMCEKFHNDRLRIENLITTTRTTTRRTRTTFVALGDPFPDLTRSSAIAGRPCDAKACQALLK